MTLSSPFARAANRAARRKRTSVPGAPVTADQYALSRLPQSLLAMTAKVLEELLFGLVGEVTQGQFTKGYEVVDPEEMRKRIRDFLGRVNVAVQHPPAELLR